MWRWRVSGRGVGAFAMVVLLVCGMGPGLGAQAVGTGYVDTAAMMLFPHDMETAGLGPMCRGDYAHSHAERGEQADIDRLISYERTPEVQDEIADLVHDGGIISLTRTMIHQTCTFDDRPARNGVSTARVTVLEQDRRRDARDVFDLIADIDSLVYWLSESEVAEVDVPKMGDEAELSVRWETENGERGDFAVVYLTVRVDTVVGQIEFENDGTSRGEPDLDPMIELGELFVERIEDGLDARRTPAGATVRILDLDDDDATVVTNLRYDHYLEFDGQRVRFSETTDEEFASLSESVQDRGKVSLFWRDYNYHVDGEHVGYVEFNFNTYVDEDSAEADIEGRVERLTNNNPGLEIEELDLEWGDHSLVLEVSMDGDQIRHGFIGYIVIGDEMAYVQVITMSEETDLESFEYVMNQQESCMESRTGCDGPIAMSEVFG